MAALPFSFGFGWADVLFPWALFLCFHSISLSVVGNLHCNLDVCGRDSFCSDYLFLFRISRRIDFHELKCEGACDTFISIFLIITRSPMCVYIPSEDAYALTLLLLVSHGAYFCLSFFFFFTVLHTVSNNQKHQPSFWNLWPSIAVCFA